MSIKEPNYRFLIIDTNNFYALIGKKLFELTPINEFMSKTPKGNKPNLVLKGIKEITDEVLKTKILNAEPGSYINLGE